MSFLTDESPYAHAITLQNGAADGGTSLTLMTGSGRAASIADSADWDLGTGPFTIEAYATFASVQTDSSFVSQWSQLNANNAWALYLAGGILRFRFFDSAGVVRDTDSAFTPVAGQRHHVAAERDGAGNVRLYLDGAPQATNSYPQAFQTSSNGVKIGTVEGFYGAFDFSGAMGPVRITRAARYAGAFAPSAYGTATTDTFFSNTVLLARFGLAAIVISGAGRGGIPINDRDVLLQATAQRYTPDVGRAILLGASATTFQVPSTGTGTPSAINFTASTLGTVMGGAINFTATAGATLTVSGRVATLTFANMTTNTATITASITVDSILYTAVQTVSKSYDGAGGLSSAVVYIFHRATTNACPALPSAACT